MTLQNFIEKYDYPASVLLLEGKRKVPEIDRQNLIKLGELIASATKHLQFRSGGAAGADSYFSRGVSNVDINRLEIILPFNSYRKHTNRNYRSYSLNDINLSNEPQVVSQSKMNRKIQRLIDLFVDGNKNHITINASFIIRDTVKVIGTSSGILPATAACFYDDLQNPGVGGTGHTMGVCMRYGIYYINQNEWFKWIE